MQDAAIILRVGSITTGWAHVEDQMVHILKMLADLPNAHTATYIFRSIINQQARLSVLRTHLEKHYLSREKDSFFDEVLAEFDSLNSQRNAYSHGLWYTDQQNGETLLAEPIGPIFLTLDAARRVTVAELDLVIARMNGLVRKIIDYRLADDRAKAQQPSPQMSPGHPRGPN